MPLLSRCDACPAHPALTMGAKIRCSDSLDEF
jgi:hypothetical protein